MSAPEPTEGIAYGEEIVYYMVTVIMIILTIFHGVKVFQDLNTRERKSVSIRRTKPTLTRSYKFINILTAISIASFAISSFAGSLSSVSVSNIECDAFITTLITSVQIAKTLMYLVFLARLHVVYGESAYYYPMKCISCFGATLLIYGIFVTILIIISVTSVLYTFGKEYPHFCYSGGGDLFLVLGAFIVIQDIAVAIGFLCAFMIPLQKTLKAVDASHGASKITRKIMYAGRKTTILTGTATCSTLLLAIFAVITGIGFITATDPIVNSICMMLMTAYYNDIMYYSKLCCCCIKCCDCCCGSCIGHGSRVDDDDDENKNSNKDKDEPTRTEIVTKDETQTVTNTKSVDTMSQLRVAGGDVQVEIEQ
eukprot:437288_1